MDIGLVGLGKMGGNMRDPPARRRPHGRRLRPQPRALRRRRLEALVERAARAPVVWVMVPAGDADPRDRPRARRPARRGRPGRRRRQLRAGPTTRSNAELLAEQGVGFVDCGVSGGVWGLENGYALMCGGSAEDVAKVQPAFDALKPEGDFGFVHAGTGRGRPLRQDGPQRHRVRDHAVLRRGLGAAGGQVDLVDNVTEVFDSWREGTVIRSWLLDLLVEALDEDDPPRRDRAATPRTPARAAGPWRPASTTRCRCRRSPPSLFARFTSRQDDSPAMKAIAAMRNQFGGHAVAHRRRLPAATPPDAGPRSWPRRVRLAPVAARLPLLRRRSTSRSGRASTAFIGRNGQGKTNLVEAVDYLSRLSSPPGRHRRAAGAGRGRPGRGARRGRPARAARRCSRSSSTRAGPTGPGSTGRRCPGPATWSAWCAPCVFSPEDLTLVKGDPGGAAPVPRRPAGAAHPAAGRGARRLRPGAQAAQLPAEDRRRRAPRRSRRAGGGAGHARRVGRPPGPDRRGAARPSGCAGRRRCGRYVGKAYETVARGAGRDDADLDYRPSLGLPDARRGEPDRARSPRRCWPSWSAVAATSSTGACRLVGPHRDDLLLTLGDGGPAAGEGLRLHGESWSFALALRLASYDLLRADGDDPILILDDVFAELDTERREPARRAGGRRRAGAGHRGGRRRRARGAGRAPGSWSPDGEVHP